MRAHFWQLATRGAGGASIGARPEDAAFRDLNGGRHALRETCGHPVVYLFLSTECPIANAYAPTLMKEGATEYEVHEDACRATIGRMLREMPRIEDQNGYGDYLLVHSTAKGEKYDPKWNLFMQEDLLAPIE